MKFSWFQDDFGVRIRPEQDSEAILSEHIGRRLLEPSPRKIGRIATELAAPSSLLPESGLGYEAELVTNYGIVDSSNQIVLKALSGVVVDQMVTFPPVEKTTDTVVITDMMK